MTHTQQHEQQELKQQQQLHHRLSFVCVNDVYSFDDVDSNNAPNNPRGGWCRAATLMKRLVRQKKQQGGGVIDAVATSDGASNTGTNDEDNATTVFTVVNGDVLGGSSLLQSSQGSIAIDIMNSIPVDLAVLGNHEFDHGDEVLMQRVNESNFVWLGSNIYYPSCHNDDKQVDKNNLFIQERVDHNSSETSTHHDSTPARNQHHYFPGIHGNGKLCTLPGCGIKVGLFGLVTKVTPLISYPSKRVTFDPDILAVARRVSRSLRARGAQIVVAITHLSEAEDRMLAMDSISGVDLILGGHEHEPLAVMVHRRNQQYGSGENEGDEKERDALHEINKDPEEENNIVHHAEANQERNEGGVLVLKCGMNAYWVGSVDLDIVIGGDNTVTSISTSWSMKAVNSRTAEDAMVSKIVTSHRKESEESSLISNFGDKLASTLHLDDVIATIGEKRKHQINSSHDLSVASSTTILPLDTRMSSVRRQEATGGNLIADAMLWMLQTSTCDENDNTTITGASSLPMLAMINGGFIRGDTLYQSGSDFTIRDVLKELPFPHSMKVLEMEGTDLKEAILQQLKGSSKGPTGAYPHLSSNASLRYVLGDNSTSPDSDGSEQFNIHSFTVNGTPVQDEHKYNIAVTTFVADGNEGCTAWLRGKRIENSAWTGVNMSFVLFKYLQCHGEIYPVLEGRVELQR